MDKCNRVAFGLLPFGLINFYLKFTVAISHAPVQQRFSEDQISDEMIGKKALNYNR
jgi:hypothetical protein